MSIQTPRISVRGLMILVLVLGAWMGWKIHRARAQRRAVAAIRGVGGRVDYDWQADPSRPGEYSSYGPGPAEACAGLFDDLPRRIGCAGLPGTNSCRRSLA